LKPFQLKDKWEFSLALVISRTTINTVRSQKCVTLLEGKTFGSASNVETALEAIGTA